MRKLAVFVEGLTERLFLESLLKAIAGARKCRIETHQVYGNKWVLIRAADPLAASEFFVLLVDCSNDTKVKSEIRDNYHGLVNAGYQSIIGIRDVYPDVTYDQIQRLRDGLPKDIQPQPIPVVFILSIMEVEAWFLAEHTHFTKIHPDLTCERIKAAKGFDPSTDDMQLRPHPKGDLIEIYHLVGMGYGKRRKHIQRTIDDLDYGRFYLDLTDKFPDLKLLTVSIDQFLSPH
jgi:hypothetical protein